MQEKLRIKNKKNIQRLALGTVQFGLDYGIANQEGQASLAVASDIINKASNAGLDTIDTAIGYGDSEEILGNIGIEKFKIISKLPALSSNSIKIQEWVDQQIQASLSRLGVSRIYGFLLHHPEDLLSEFGNELYDALLNLKQQSIVQKIGISVYTPHEVDAILNKFQIDLIQLPFNILDRRFLNQGYFKIFKDRGIEIHTRSAFLQGILLMPHDDIPKNFNKWNEIWKRWFSWQKETGCSALQACLAYNMSVPEIDRVLVGVQSVDQMNQILHYMSRLNISEFPEFNNVSDELINPSKWTSI